MKPVKMNSLKYILSSLLIVLAAGVMRLQAQSESGVMIDEIIAKVDNYIVLKSDLEKAYLNYLSQGGQA